MSPVRIHVIGVVWLVAYTVFTPLEWEGGIPLWFVHIVFSPDQNSGFKLVKTAVGFSFNGDPIKVYSSFFKGLCGAYDPN